MNTNYSFGVKNIEKVPTSFKHNISFIATAGLWECGGNGYCLDRPDDPNKTCHCPYVPPKPKPAVCKQGQACGEPFIKRNTGICGDGGVLKKRKIAKNVHLGYWRFLRKKDFLNFLDMRAFRSTWKN